MRSDDLARPDDLAGEAPLSAPVAGPNPGTEADPFTDPDLIAVDLFEAELGAFDAPRGEGYDSDDGLDEEEDDNDDDREVALLQELGIDLDAPDEVEVELAVNLDEEWGETEDEDESEAEAA